MKYYLEVRSRISIAVDKRESHERFRGYRYLVLKSDTE
jgi:hypothetical protein